MLTELCDKYRHVPKSSSTNPKLWNYNSMGYRGSGLSIETFRATGYGQPDDVQREELRCLNRQILVYKN
jgi:hypothetical protein